jgi:hypothetical protein
VRYVHAAAVLSFENSSLAEEYVGEPDGLLVDSVLARHQLSRRQSFSWHPLAGLDAGSDVSGDAAVARVG